jgi:hypothetical protein
MLRDALFMVFLVLAGCAGGETGSIGPAECSRDQDCREMLEAELADFARPHASDRALLAAECLTAESVEARAPAPPPSNCERGDRRDECAEAGRDFSWLVTALRCGDPLCACFFGWDGDIEVRLEHASVLGYGAEAGRCDVYGRTGECLLRADDFAGCDPAQADSCERACADAEALRAADAARRFEAEVRVARCEQYRCQAVLRVGDQCFAGRPTRTDENRFDCGLSDQEILRRGYPPPGDAPGAMVGVSTTPMPACDR